MATSKGCALTSFLNHPTDWYPQENVLMAGDGYVKLTDFGLSIMHDDVLLFSETDPGGGTARWMV